MDYSAVVNEDDAHLLATHIAACSAFPAAVKCAIELNLFELMKQLAGFVSASELAAKVAPANSEAHLMIDRILRLLASYSVVKCRHTNNERQYSLGPVCEFFTNNQDGASLAPLFLLMHANLYQTSWGKLKDSIVEGGVSFNKAHGMSLYEHSGLNPKSNKLFFDAMSNNSTILMKKIVATYNGFEGLNSIVDVGGGIGSTTNMIASRYPMIKGINFDLLHVIQHAPSYSGVEHIAGDMFVNVPKADAIFLKEVTHNWSDEQCVKLLKNCYDAIPANGKVILVELVLPEGPDYNGVATQNALSRDLMMMCFTQGGKERTETEFETLAMDAGFIDFKKAACSYNYWIMELRK